MKIVLLIPLLIQVKWFFEWSLFFSSQVEAQNLVVRKLEEKERYMHSTIVNLDKEANLRLVVSEVNKKKVSSWLLFRACGRACAC